MLDAFKDIFKSVSSRQRERRAANVNDLKTLAVMIGENELGISKYEIDVDYYAAALESERLSESDLRQREADLQVNVDYYKERERKSKLAVQVTALQDAAVAAEQVFRDADVEEGRRRREAAANFEKLEAAMRHALQLSDEAVGARSDLIAGAAVTDEERGLNAEFDAIQARITKLAFLVDPHACVMTGDLPDGDVYWSSIDGAPAKLASQVTQMLAKGNAKSSSVGYSPERRKELERTLAAADARVAEHRKELSKLEKQRGVIEAKLVKLILEKLKPENFTFVRAKPTRDDAAKRRALEFGFHGGTGVTTGRK